jgi:hypothetical protein
MTIHPYRLLDVDHTLIHIIYPVAVTTKEVMMGLCLIVIVGLAALDDYLLNEPVLFKEIKGIIDRGPREGGIDPLEGFVDILGSGMLGVVLEKFQDR